MPFTSWSWNILGLSFAFSGLVTLFVEEHSQKYDIGDISSFPYMHWALRGSILLFEISAPISMLVSAVVKYALWPKALKGNGTAGLKRKAVLLQHNANVIMSLVEVGLLGGLPIRFTDMALAPMFGITYVFFAWGMRFQWVPSREPQFLYFFMDTTLGKTSTIALVVLVVILTVFYGIFVVMADVILYLGGGLLVHSAIVVLISTLTCRFRD